MSDNVKELDLKRPNPWVVEQLEGMLERAKAGDIVGIAGAVYLYDGRTAEHWVDTPSSYSMTVVGDRMIGCLERIKVKLILNSYGLLSDRLPTITEPPPDEGA